ncbi:MAG: glycosyltransferase family 2 protein [Oscillospiraceae bacterium]|jgi:glycosyltransferase involved in cell wall biosynthesis|nr:glycosyltransferase family 2 protein [Oscillospiraceae bacterium]
MAENKKKKQAHRRRPAGAKRPPVRLSQCMIVKNEEKNIEKALGWAKDIAFEQIVVDTGSTDRTVELAEKMGARVLHFEWINDFSAAKNFAIEQARGNWIAFLDADEYFDEKDTKLLWGFLERAEANPKAYPGLNFIRCRWINLNDKGEAFVIQEQDRVFRNKPEIRYVNKIHEHLSIGEGGLFLTDIKIYHTGYTKEAMSSKNTFERNLAPIEEELRENPDNLTMKGYLADTLRAAPGGVDTARVVELYTEIIEGSREGKSVYKFTVDNAYAYLSNYYLNQGEEKWDYALELSREASNASPENPDFDYYLGLIHHARREFADAWDCFKRCEGKMFGENIPRSFYILGNSSQLFIKMLQTAVELRDNESFNKYLTLLFKTQKYEAGIIGPLIAAVSALQPSADELLEMLGRYYDLGNLRDKVFLARAAVRGACHGLASTIMEMITKEELDWVDGADAPAAEAEDGEAVPGPA